MKTPAPKKQSTLKTPQSLIHVKHNMTLVQYKYWILFLHDVKRQILQGVEPDKRGYYYISMDEVNALMGTKATQKKSIIFDDLRQLKDITVSYNVLQKDGHTAKVGHGFISEWSVSNSKIGYVLPRIFIEAMLELDNTEVQSIFHLLNWEVFNSFSGKYEAIIYKLCKDYMGVGKTPKFSVDEFRAYMGLNGNEYPEFKRLSEWVIQKPLKIINESDVSDVLVKVEFTREKRKVVALQFFIEPKQPPLPFDEFKPHIAFVGAKIPIAIDKQQEYLKQYNQEQVEAIIQRANEYAQELTDNGKKANIGAIYKKAFESGWGLDNLEAKKQEKAEADEKKRQAEAKRKAELKAEQVEKARQKREKEEIEKCLKIFENLPQDEQEKILDEIENQTPPFMQKWFKNDRKDGNNPCRRPPFNFGLRDIIKERYVIEK